MPYGNIRRNLNNEGNMSGILTIQPTAGSVVSDVLVNGTSAVSDHKAYINIDVDQTVTEGQKIASININGQSTDILIPELNVYDEATGDLITIDDAMQAPAVDLSVTLEPQQAGTGDPSPENVRPISGWTECKVQRTGVNIWDEEWEAGAYNNDGEKVQNSYVIRSKNPIPVKPSTTYYFKIPLESPVLTMRRVYWDKDMRCISSIGSLQGNIEFTTPNDCFYIGFNMSGVYGSTYGNNISINYPSTDTDYHSSHATTYTINLGGTYYGGNLDAVDGKLLPYKYYASYNGETLIGPWISSMDAYTPQGTPTTGAQVVDFGAFETEVTLTPTQIDLLRGVNNIWSDGEVYVKWKVDIEMMLQSIIDSRHI